MRQVFFITDEKMTVMLWQGSRLLSKYEFEDNEKSIGEFRQYISSSKNIISSIILDILEEEITLTNIPHVNAKERKFLIGRTLTRLHRGTEFSTAQVIGREKVKRRDDRLLVSGLTTDRRLTKWLNLLNESEVFLQGIYSLPLIADNVLKVLNQTKGITMLVSRQSGAFIRQSIFKQGKLFYSRNIPSAFDLQIETFSSDLQKTRKYLENQKLVTPQERINVIVMASDSFYSQLSGVEGLLPDMDISYVRHEQMKDLLGIESSICVGGKEIYSLLLLNSNVKSHYGRDEDLGRFQRKVRNDRLNYASIALAVLLMMMVVKFNIDINVIDNKISDVQAQISSLKVENNKLDKNLSYLPAKTKKMKLFVDNLEEINNVNKNDIEQAMVRISQIINAYSNIELDVFNWSLSSSEYYKNKKIKKNKRNKSVAKSQVIEIVARLNVQSLSNEKTKLVVEKFISSLQGVDGVRLVTLTQSPTKSDSSDRLSGVIAGTSASFASFALTVFLEPVEHAG